MRQEPLRQEARPETRQEPRQETSTLDSGQEACGILEVMRTDLDLSAPTTICRATAMSTFPRPKSAVSD